MNICVIGVPLPQGSKSARVIPGKNGGKPRAIMTEGFGTKPVSVAAWRHAIAQGARDWCAANGMPAPIDEAVIISVTFFLPRPASIPKSRLLPSKKPDLDKLMRAVGDALKGIAYTEDSRITDSRQRKRYAVNGPPRAEIALWRALEEAYE